MIIVPEVVPIRTYIVRETSLLVSPSRVQPKEFYPSTSRVVSYRVRLV
jgi:hypothetical protein